MLQTDRLWRRIVFAVGDSLRPLIFMAGALLLLTGATPLVGVAQPLEATTFQPPIPNDDAPLYVFDLDAYLQRFPDNKVWQYDVIAFLTAMQGLVNRHRPQLYLNFVHENYSVHGMNVDQFWLGRITSRGGFLHGVETHVIDELEDLIDIFRPYFSALVLWDPQVPASFNVAMTVCGVDSLLPLRHDPSPGSLFTQIVSRGPQLPVRENLRGRFTGVGRVQLPPPFQDEGENMGYAKGDAYFWAKTLYLNTGRVSSTYLAYFIDAFDWEPDVPGFQYPDLYNAQIVNRDFYVSNRAFFLDLDPWWDQIPTDIGSTDQFQRGIDYTLLGRILRAAYTNTRADDRLLRVGGFVPWWAKYSAAARRNSGEGHSVEETAEEFVRIVSSYNGVIDADSDPFGAMANASVFQHASLQSRYRQNPTPPPRPLENKNYLLFALGDFRSSAMLYQTLPILWNDASRGALPITWALAPMMSERVPHIFDFMYQTRTPNDYFAGAGAGAGLTYPNQMTLPRGESGIGESGLPHLGQWAERLYRRFDMPFAFAADLDRGRVRESRFIEPLQRFFLSFAPHGVSVLKPFQTDLVERLLPFIEESGAVQERTPLLESVVDRIIADAGSGQPSFLVYRFNLANPTTLHLIWQRLNSKRPDLDFDLVDPYTFFYLLRQHRANGDPSVNHLLPNFLEATIPNEMPPGVTYNARLTLRNDGWDVWNPPNLPSDRRYRLTYRWRQFADPSQVTLGLHDAFIERPTPPGDEVDITLAIQTPDDFDGLYSLELVFGLQNVRDSPLIKRMNMVILPGIEIGFASP